MPTQAITTARQGIKLKNIIGSGIHIDPDIVTRFGLASSAPVTGADLVIIATARPVTQGEAGRVTGKPRPSTLAPAVHRPCASSTRPSPQSAACPHVAGACVCLSSGYAACLQQDQWNRCTVGAVNLVPSFFGTATGANSSVVARERAVALQQVLCTLPLPRMHVLQPRPHASRSLSRACQPLPRLLPCPSPVLIGGVGMAPTSIFVDKFGEPTISGVYQVSIDDGHYRKMTTKITSPRVADAAKAHFACDSLAGVRRASPWRFPMRSLTCVRVVVRSGGVCVCAGRSHSRMIPRSRVGCGRHEWSGRPSCPPATTWASRTSPCSH